MKENRIFYFDFIKAAAIYLVCFYHFSFFDKDFLAHPSFTTYANYFITGLASMAVPLFFFVNGAILLNKDYGIKGFVIKTARLIALTLIWATITLFAIAPLFEDEYTLKSFVYMLMSLNEDRIGHLWFLGALLFIYLLYPILKAAFEKGQKDLNIYLLGIVALFTFGNIFFNSMAHVTGYFFHVDKLAKRDFNIFFLTNPFENAYAYALVYFISGGFFVKYGWQHLVSFRVALIGFLSACTVLFVYGVIESRISAVSYDTVWYGYNSVMTYVMALSFVILCSKIKRINRMGGQLIHLVGSNTFGIYLLHFILGSWISGYYKSLFGAVTGNFFMNLIYAFFILMLSLLITLGLKKIPYVRRLVML